jgi:hypothetical protein
MQQLSVKHGFWAKMTVDAHEQYASDFDTSLVIKNLTIASMTFARHNPCQAATKGFRDATYTISGQIVDTSRPRKKYEREPYNVKELFIQTQLLHALKLTKMLRRCKKSSPSNPQQQRMHWHLSPLQISTSPLLLIPKPNYTAKYLRH